VVALVGRELAGVSAGAEVVIAVALLAFVGTDWLDAVAFQFVGGLLGTCGAHVC
jgi:hypothetical protein